jgi:hypothetical protein
VYSVDNTVWGVFARCVAGSSIWGPSLRLRKKSHHGLSTLYVVEFSRFVRFSLSPIANTSIRSAVQASSSAVAIACRCFFLICCVNECTCWNRFARMARDVVYVQSSHHSNYYLLLFGFGMASTCNMAQNMSASKRIFTYVRTNAE